MCEKSMESTEFVPVEEAMHSDKEQNDLLIESQESQESDQFQKRRTSSRSIRRKKFDDELVESSLSKCIKGKQQSPSFIIPTCLPSTSSTKTFMEAQIEARKKKCQRKILPKRLKMTKKFSKYDRRGPAIWQPCDDLCLILSVMQTNDLRAVFRGVRFSSEFSFKEIEERWRTLMYDPIVSNSALAAIRHMSTDEVMRVRKNVLYSQEEESVLETVSKFAGTHEEFDDLLENQGIDFLHSRTSEDLREYWCYMKKYNLLCDQIFNRDKENIMTFSEAEEDFDEGKMPFTDKIDKEERHEVEFADRMVKLEMKQLENDLGKLDSVLEHLFGCATQEEADNSIIASLRGQTVNYLMQNQEVTIGRSDGITNVDVDLSLEGPASRVSRRQGLLFMDKDGNFFIINEGKKPFYIDGVPVLANEKFRVVNNCTVEIGGLSFTFHTHPEGIAQFKKSLNDKN